MYRPLEDSCDGPLSAAVERRRPEFEDLLADLVSVPSVAGGERPAQELVATRLEQLGFATNWLELREDAATTPGGGVPEAPTSGRHVLVAERRDGSHTSLLVNGHIDVIPPGDDSLWTNPPFSPSIKDGWLYGRGAGDMKGGLVMTLLALQALQDCAPQSLEANLTVVVPPEKETSGNGTLTSILAGVRGDVALLPEPTGLEVVVAGVGVLWCDVCLRGDGSGSAAGAAKPVNPIDKLLVLRDRVQGLERMLAALCASTSDGVPRCSVHCGTIAAGDWHASLPTSARARLQIEYPQAITCADAEALVRTTIAEAVRADPWLMQHPPKLKFRGLRAEPHALDASHALVGAVVAAHRDTHGSEAPVAHAATISDARFYRNQAGIPAVAYGPRTRNRHGIDEAVELESIAAGACTLTRLIPTILASPPETFA